MSNGTTGTTTGVRTGSSALPAVGGSSASTLSEWAGPYVTGMLGKAQALSELPYQTYQGPLTAGASPLQQQVFQGLGSLTLPSSVGQAATMAGDVASKAMGAGYAPTQFASAFQTPGAYQPATAANQYQATAPYQAGQFTSGFQTPGAYQPTTGSFTEQGVAGQYMNPYLRQALDPQLEELRRQAQISRVQNAARMTKAGAYGGGRQAILESELDRNLMQQMGRTTGEAYTTAFDKAMAQYNAEQQRRMQEAQFGATQGMTAAELAARYGQSAQQAAEQSRQFGAQQALENARMAAQYGLSGQQLAEQSRQFGAQQGMTGAQLAAQYGSEAQRAAEQSRQFGASYGLDALSRALSAAQAQGQLGMGMGAEQRANLAQQMAGGAAQRAIEQEGITADLNEFLQQRDYPMRQVQFLQSMLQGLPISTVTNTPAQQSTLGQLTSTVGGLGSLLESLKKLGVGLGG